MEQPIVNSMVNSYNTVRASGGGYAGVHHIPTSCDLCRRILISVIVKQGTPNITRVARIEVKIKKPKISCLISFYALKLSLI